MIQQLRMYGSKKWEASNHYISQPIFKHFGEKRYPEEVKKVINCPR